MRLNKQQLEQKICDLENEVDGLKQQVLNLKAYAEKESTDRQKAENENEILNRRVSEYRQAQYKDQEFNRLEQRVKDAIAIIEAQFLIKTGASYTSDDAPKNARFLVALHRALQEECPF